MGLRFRKSINLGGGFRINVSKSGVGYSWGVPGYRITKTATGRRRKTYSIPGTGISYVEESGSSRRKNLKNEYIQSSKDVLIDIDSADINELQPVEYKELLKSIEKSLILNKISNMAMCSIILANPVFLVIAILGLILKIVLFKWGRVQLNYELDQYTKEKHSKNCESWLILNENDKVWQIIQAAHVSNIKVNAGASRNINRKEIKFAKKTPFYINTNIDTISVKLRKETLIFLPDKIIIIRGVRVGAVDYDDVRVSVGDIMFIESGMVPKDAEIINYTWQFVNKNGSPDRRYKDNRQLPVCLYGVVKVESLNGVNIEIQCSNFNKTKLFGGKIK